MAPFYPYIHLNHTHLLPCTPSSHLHQHDLTLREAVGAATSSIVPMDVINSKNTSGTSLSAGGIIGIVAGIVFLFGGLAWFVWHALGVLPRQKKVILKERRKQREKAKRHTERATRGIGGSLREHHASHSYGRQHEYENYA